MSMNKHTLSIPKLFFLISTRAALAAGVALLASSRLTDKTRRRAGLAMMSIGGLTTVPALMMMKRSKARLGWLG